MEHHGVVTRDACIRAGISSASWYRAHRDGMLEPLHRNVARMVGTPRTRQQAVCAAVLAAGRGALASHRSAAFLWGIPRPDVDPVDVLLPDRARRASLSPVVVHRPSDLGDLKPVRRQGIPVTNVATHALRPRCRRCPVGERRGRPRGDDRIGVTGVAASGVGTPRPTGARRRRRPARRARRLGHRRQAGGQRARASDASAPASPRSAAGWFHAVICGYEVDFWLIGTPVVLECDGWTWHGRQRSVFERTRSRRRARRQPGQFPSVRSAARAPDRSALPTHAEERSLRSERGDRFSCGRCSRRSGRRSAGRRQRGSRRRRRRRRSPPPRPR